MAAPPPDLERRLLEADEEQLVELLARYGEKLEVGPALAALRNPFAGRRAVESLLGVRRLLVYREVRRALAVHPATPESHAMRLASGLFWRDLLRVGADAKVRPAIRRVADRSLAERLPALAVGERMAIARGGGPGVIERIRHDPEERVVGALLENPRLTEGLLTPLVSSDSSRPRVLALVARDRRWGRRYTVRLAVCGNPRTPVEVTLPLLPSLKKVDLKRLSQERRLPLAVRRRIDLLLGRGSGAPEPGWI